MRQERLVQAEAILEEWVKARGEAPTAEASEGFRLLALHRQGARGVPSFNACRETCREIAYHYNLLGLEQEESIRRHRENMLAMLVEHLKLFVRGKLEVEGLGEFCCSSRALRKESETEKTHG
jgi:hypothetical protein